MVVSWIKLLNMLRRIHLKLRLTIHTLLENIFSDAKPRQDKVLVKLLDTKMLHQTQLLNWKLPSCNNQFQLPLKLIKAFSKTTILVFSTHQSVERSLIMVSLLLVTEPIVDKITSSSRTPGEHHGVMKDILKSPLVPITSAVSSLNHHIQLNEIRLQSNDSMNKFNRINKFFK